MWARCATLPSKHSSSVLSSQAAYEISQRFRHFCQNCILQRVTYFRHVTTQHSDFGSMLWKLYPSYSHEKIYWIFILIIIITFITPSHQSNLNSIFFIKLKNWKCENLLISYSICSFVWIDVRSTCPIFGVSFSFVFVIWQIINKNTEMSTWSRVVRCW